MGQGSSRQEIASPQRHPQRRSTLLRPTSVVETAPEPPASSTNSRRRSTFFGALAPSSSDNNVDEPEDPLLHRRRRRSRLSRSISFRTSFPNPFNRSAAAQPRTQPHPPSPATTRIQTSDEHDVLREETPQLQTPSFDHSLDFPSLRRARPLSDDSAIPASESTQSLERSSSISSRWRARSPFNRSNPTSSIRFRRRNSPMSRNPENQDVALNRVLQAAAGLTALSLSGRSDNTTLRTLTDGERTLQDEDGSFNAFIQTLNNGELAHSLNHGEGPQANLETSPGQHMHFDFLRMFRFGSNNNRQRLPSPSSGPASSRSPGPRPRPEPVDARSSADPDRMVSVVIVGIRALPQREMNQERIEGMPSFLDTLASTMPRPLGAAQSDQAVAGEEEFEASSTRRSRRSTIGGINSLLNNGADAQSDEEARPATSQALTSESPLGPHPPPTTPASPGLSAMSSGANTPTRRSSMSSFTDLVGTQSRRSSIYRRLTGTALEPTLEEQTPPEAPYLRPRGLRRRPRISSWAEGSRHDPRRNGVLMEPSSESPDANSSARSWIIYILGGNYPEGHPILTTPSLFTDSPSYEDMMLLSNLLGPVKPPVAHADDVASAGGVFTILTEDEHNIATASNSGESIRLSLTEQCLVCLSPYYAGEEARRLGKCKHFFHRECIDQWLTTGRNSCPLCRTQGVDEKDRPIQTDDMVPDVEASGPRESAADAGTTVR